MSSGIMDSLKTQVSLSSRKQHCANAWAWFWRLQLG